VPAVPVLLGLAAWREHPDRAQVLRMLREIAAAPGELRSVVAAGADLVEAVLPERHRGAWELEIADSADSEEEEDAVLGLEDWVHSGTD
jgi:hypothetical protein